MAEQSRTTLKGYFNTGDVPTEAQFADLIDSAASPTELSGKAASSHTHTQSDLTGLTTADSPQFTGINLGHASDTTITRVSAGVIAVEGSEVLTGGSGTTLTNPSAVVGADIFPYFKNADGLPYKRTATEIIGDLSLVTLTGTQTLTNKTLTAPIVDGVPIYSNLPQNSQSAAYTLVLGDANKHIFHPSADTTARTWTIPANASVAFPVGTAVTFINQNGAGVITIAITTDTMRLAGAGTTGSRTLAANGLATAIKVTSTEWIISGTGLT